MIKSKKIVSEYFISCCDNCNKIMREMVYKDYSNDTFYQKIGSSGATQVNKSEFCEKCLDKAKELLLSKKNETSTT